jgi:hypothetical protein
MHKFLMLVLTTVYIDLNFAGIIDPTFVPILRMSRLRSIKRFTEKLGIPSQSLWDKMRI